jgi:hypothetical protein
MLKGGYANCRNSTSSRANVDRSLRADFCQYRISGLAGFQARFFMSKKCCRNLKRRLPVVLNSTSFLAQREK